MGVVSKFGFDSGGTYPKRVEGNKTKHYNTWIDVMKRCYNEDWKKSNTTYLDVWLCESWHDYQNFAEWFENNYREGYQIDKDILSIYFGEGFYYSPKTCRMIPKDLNLLLTNRKGRSRNTDLPLGVSKSKGGYTAWCNNGQGKTVNLGQRSCPDEAFNLYKEYKENLIKSKAKYYHENGAIDDVVMKALYSYEVIPNPKE